MGVSFDNEEIRLIKDKQQLTKAVKARLAYLRLGPTFWHQIHNDLQDHMRQGQIYRFLFAQIILKKNRSLWNGTNNVNTVFADEPSHPIRNQG
ncbi:hypothetical protein VP01_1458g6 [Puccinia sorghi]|uniref:Uncharacterized protein n=1 Tax=Puccinia sorghi TaxID=27349 RepID=A0A0L6VJW7_9BASI|nr:hypothetical protein VP01_1458g6 [Puccinia sorghi]